MEKQDTHSIIIYSTNKEGKIDMPMHEAETCTEINVSSTLESDKNISRMTTKQLLDKIKLERDSKLSNPNAWYEQTQSRFAPTRTLSQKRRLSQNIWEKKHKRYGCCFKTKDGCMHVCPWIIFWALVSIALTLFFVWPRKLTLEISSPIQEPMNTLHYYHGGKGNQSLLLKNASPALPFCAYATVLFPVSIESFNWIPITADELYLEYHMVINGTKYTTLNGTSVYNQAFLKAQSVSSIHFPVSLGYYTTISGVTNDLLLLSKTCNSKSSTMTIDVSITMTWNAIAWLGIKPKFSNIATVNCPWPLVELSGIVLDTFNF